MLSFHPFRLCNWLVRAAFSPSLRIHAEQWLDCTRPLLMDTLYFRCDWLSVLDPACYIWHDVKQLRNLFPYNWSEPGFVVTLRTVKVTQWRREAGLWLALKGPSVLRGEKAGKYSHHTGSWKGPIQTRPAKKRKPARAVFNSGTLLGNLYKRYLFRMF